MLNRREKAFRKAIQLAFSGDAGQTALAYLKESYVNNTALKESVELTYYRLGQKELIQSILTLVGSEDTIDEKITKLETDY